MSFLRVALASAGLALGAASIACAADKPCTKADAVNGEKAIERANNWSQLYKTWQDYRHCDTGAVADGYTDSLMRLMVEWKSVDALAAAMEKDPAFKEWIYARLKSPAAKDDQPAVYSRAMASCPKAMDAFCAELAESVKPAAK
ncbi:MAG TPA: hypothetical protein VF309_05340 [Usitatibacter sp.]